MRWTIIAVYLRVCCMTFPLSPVHVVFTVCTKVFFQCCSKLSILARVLSKKGLSFILWITNEKEFKVSILAWLSMKFPKNVRSRNVRYANCFYPSLLHSYGRLLSNLITEICRYSPSNRIQRSKTAQILYKEIIWRN